MKIVAIAHRAEGRKPKEFTPHLAAEANHALRLLAEEKVREIYSRADGKGAVLVLEAKDEAEARHVLDGLPMVKLGLIRFDIYGTRPYRGIVQHVK